MSWDDYTTRFVGGGYRRRGLRGFGDGEEVQTATVPTLDDAPVETQTEEVAERPAVQRGVDLPQETATQVITTKKPSRVAMYRTADTMTKASKFALAKPLEPVFCRSGSKKDIMYELMKDFPDHNLYCEFFIGSAAVYWAKKPAQASVINDFESDLADGYYVIKTLEYTNDQLKAKNTEFETAVPSGAKASKTRATRDFAKYPRSVDGDKRYLKEVQLPAFANKWLKPKLNAENQITTDGVDALAFEITRYCNGFSNLRVEVEENGNPIPFAQFTKKFAKVSNPYSKLLKLDAYQNHMRTTTVHNADFFDLYKRYDKEGAFWFLDPPYVMGSELYAVVSEADSGSFDFTKFFKKFQDALSSVKNAKWMVTIDDDVRGLIRRTFKGVRGQQVYVREILVGAKGQEGGIGGKDRRELIFTNYDTGNEQFRPVEDLPDVRDEKLAQADVAKSEKKGRKKKGSGFLNSLSSGLRSFNKWREDGGVKKALKKASAIKDIIQGEGYSEYDEFESDEQVGGSFFGDARKGLTSVLKMQPTQYW